MTAGSVGGASGANAPLPIQNPTAAARVGNVPVEGAGNAGVSTLAELKNQSPELYKAMMDGIAMQICNESKRAQDRLRKIAKEARNE